MTILEQKISACREALQRAIERGEKVVALQKQFDEEIDWQEIQDEKIRDEWGSWGYV